MSGGGAAARLRSVPMRAALALLAAVVLLLAVAPSAEAGWPRVERAQAVAAKFWRGTAPACGAPVTVRAETDELPEAFTTIYDPATLDPAWAGIGDEFNCVIYLRRTWLRQRPSWWSFCMVWLHEYGHVLGHDHPAEGEVPSNRWERIMVPGVGFFPRACRRG